MLNALIIGLLTQSLLVLPPRTALENPSTLSQVPPKVQKDYDKIWARFQGGKEDPKLVKDIDKLIKKQTFDPLVMIQAYLALYAGDDLAARQKFMQVLMLNPDNRIALYYLAELAYSHHEYARAMTLYAQLMTVDSSHPEIATKHQRARLLATDELLRSIARAESENRLSEAEDSYRQILTILPKDPTVHARLADLLARLNKKDEAEAERKIAEELVPRRVGSAHVAESSSPKNDTLEDLGRWSGEIAKFHEIRDAQAITREQLAVLIVRYFPQVLELRQNPGIITDLQESHAVSEIQTVLGIGLLEPFPNHTFEPQTPVTRGELATALARLSRLLNLSQGKVPAVPAPDVAETNAQYPDIQAVLGSGVMTLDDAGNFNTSGQVSGRDAVRFAERLMRSFQQAQR